MYSTSTWQKRIHEVIKEITDIKTKAFEIDETDEADEIDNTYEIDEILIIAGSLLCLGNNFLVEGHRLKVGVIWNEKIADV